MIPCGVCGSYALSRSSDRRQPNSLNLQHDEMVSSKVLYSALAIGVLALAAVVALSVTVAVYGKQIMDFVHKHDWHNSTFGDPTESSINLDNSTAYDVSSTSSSKRHPATTRQSGLNEQTFATSSTPMAPVSTTGPLDNNNKEPVNLNQDSGKNRGGKSVDQENSNLSGNLENANQALENTNEDENEVAVDSKPRKKRFGFTERE